MRFGKRQLANVILVAVIGVVAISSSKDYLQGQIQLIEKQAVRIANDNGAEVVDVFVEYL